MGCRVPDSVLAGTAPEIRRMVTELLRKTLAANPEKRYASCAELLAQIEPFLDSFQQPKPYLQTKLPLGNNYFCGRDIELQEIHTLLQQKSSCCSTVSAVSEKQNWQSTML